MFVSPYMTQYTREQLAGKRTPSRDMRNKKAEEQAARRRAWAAGHENAGKVASKSVRLK